MPDQTISAGHPAQEPREPVRIHTSRIEDACIDKDCIEDLRVYLTGSSQKSLEGAVNARARSAELLHVYIDVAPIAYNPGHFTADLTFFYRIGGEAMSGVTRPAPLEGLAVFTKRVVLFGGQTATKVFSSADNDLLPDALYQTHTPDCVVEAVDPMVLSSRVGEGSDTAAVAPEIPQAVRALFPEEPVLNGAGPVLHRAHGARGAAVGFCGVLCHAGSELLRRPRYARRALRPFCQGGFSHPGLLSLGAVSPRGPETGRVS